MQIEPCDERCGKRSDAGIIYPISDSKWVSPVKCMPKKGGMPVITNEKNELIPTKWMAHLHGLSQA